MEKEIANKIINLYNLDTKESYQNLLDLENISDNSDILYPYIDEFISMLESDKYIIRVRGFRLLCKQAKWDYDMHINKHIKEILLSINDDKPTAVRQKLQYLEFIVMYKNELHDEVKRAVLDIDMSRFKDTMKPLIEKDIKNLLKMIKN